MQSRRFVSPVFQPVVEMQSGALVYLEALARTPERTDGHLKLIELGESYGFVHLIDLEMLEQVFPILEDNPENVVAVNVSVLTIERSLNELLSRIFLWMSCAERVVFEITETVKISRPDRIKLFVDTVRMVHARIALDDYSDGVFGAGIIELLKPDFVKFDGSSVDRISETGDTTEIVRISKKIEPWNGRVIAEKVDSFRKLDILKSAGIELGQGYCFGKAQHYKSMPSSQLQCCLQEAAAS